MSSKACSTRVTKVIVHGNGALVTRRGVVAGGSREVLIEGLPLLFSSDTLRVRPVGEGGCTVGVVDEVCRIGVTSAAPIAGAAALVEARLAVAANDQRRRVMKTLLQHADAGIELPPADVEGLPDTALLLRLSTVNAKRRRQLVSEVRVLDEQARELARVEKRAALDVRPDETPPRILRGLRVGVDASADAEIAVEYFVAAARWVPSYALHLSSTEQGTRARLVLGALVAQASGEDWDDVELRVSTADLRRETTLPVLHSWRLGRAQPARAKGFRPLPSDLPGLFSGWDRFPLGPASAPPTTTQATKATGRRARTERAEVEEEGVLSLDEHTDAALAKYDTGAAAEPEPLAGKRKGGGVLGAVMAASVALPSQAQAFSSAPGGSPLRAAAAPSAMLFSKDQSAMPLPPPAPRPVVVDELPPRLRTSSLRMAAADEGTHLRGLLLPLDPLQRLEWLLDAADVAAGDATKAELRRAIAALEQARRQLLGRPLPRGTAAVGGGGAAAIFGTAALTKTSIPGDGNDHRVEVHEEEGDAAILHLAVPRESLDVWRACRFKAQQPLPTGPVQVYEEGAFVVAGRVEGGGGGKPLTFNLGVDPDVRIKARTPHTHQSEKGLMGGTTQIEQKVLVEVRSSRKVPVRLSLYERMPIVEENQKDVVVSALTSKPPAVRTDKGPNDEELKGGLRFDLSLMPGDLAVVEHSYTITLPAKSELVGGNRRE